MRRVDKGIPLERVKGQGRKRHKMTQKLREKFVEKIDGKIGVSTTKLAKKFKISQPYVRQLIKFYNLRKWKRKSRPKVTDKQKKTQKVRLNKMRRKLCRPSSKIEIVMDDESYFSISGHNNSSNDHFYAFDRENTDPNVKYRNVTKFPTRSLVWIAISSKCISKPFFVQSRGAINANYYIKDCIIKRLLPFINKNHSDGKYLFWPDLASSHYAKRTREAYATHNIKFVPKECNPPNVPQLRPIEDFWGILKG